MEGIVFSLLISIRVTKVILGYSQLLPQNLQKKMALKFRSSIRPLLKYSSSSSSSSSTSSIRLVATIAATDDDAGAATVPGDAAFGFDVADLATARPMSEIPGPRRLPLIGTLHALKPFGKIDIFDARAKGKTCDELYGKIHKGHLPFLPGGDTIISLRDPKDFNIVFRNEGKGDRLKHECYACRSKLVKIRVTDGRTDRPTDRPV